MAAYVLVLIRDSTDPDALARYREHSTPAVEAHGGRFVARGGELAVLEGDQAPERVVVVEFPDLATARTWYDSPEYRAAREVREGAAHFDIVAVEGL